MTDNIKRAQQRTDQALALLDAGFTSKARQKEAFGYLGRSYNLLRDIIHASACALANANDPDREDAEAWFDKVAEYDMPFDLHNVRERHIAKARELNDDIASRIAFLVETRAAVKAAPVEPPAPKKPSPYQVKAEKTLMELIEKRKAQYLEAVELGRAFNGLPVTANVHYVINQHGTAFNRAFYYLNGKLTPLSVLIAAAEALAREGE